jgi:hypothetical protein
VPQLQCHTKNKNSIVYKWDYQVITWILRVTNVKMYFFRYISLMLPYEQEFMCKEQPATGLSCAANLNLGTEWSKAAW